MSLHFNATQAGKNEVEGPETYCITPVGAASSNAQGEGSSYGATTANRSRISEPAAGVSDGKIARAKSGRGRPWRPPRAFCRPTRRAMPAILIEGAYMTNPTESKRIYDVRLGAGKWRRPLWTELPMIENWPCRPRPIIRRRSRCCSEQPSGLTNDTRERRVPRSACNPMTNQSIFSTAVHAIFPAGRSRRPC